MKEYSILVGGAAGDGSKKAGLMIAKLFSSYGYYIHIHEDYQSVVRGGHNFSLIRASEKKVSAPREEIDILIALDRETVEKHSGRLKDKRFLIYNSDEISLKRGIALPADKLIKEAGGLTVMRNTALVSALSKTVGIDWVTTKRVLTRELPVETDKNIEIAKNSYDKTDRMIKVERISSEKRPLLSGNQAIALAAIEEGIDSYIAYPMTPATGILNCISLIGPEYGVKVFQPESEIAAANLAVGVAFAGKKVMVGTSGGGFALMNEAISLAGITETPLVTINVQRSGPSTGLPTYGGQPDLLHTLSSGHGDFERFVVAPGDVEEAFHLTQLALKVAWRYQLPAIILSDKDLAESTYSFEPELLKKYDLKEVTWKGKGEYKRFEITKDGISPLAFPGDGRATVKSSSFEHNEFGLAIEDALTAKEMQDKRARKFKTLEKELSKIKAVNVYGNRKSSTALIAWGSTKGAALELALRKDFKLIQPMIMNPFPAKEIKAALKGVDRIVTIETNTKGQLAQLLKIKSEKVLKYDGRAFTIDELIKKVK